MNAARPPRRRALASSASQLVGALWRLGRSRQPRRRFASASESSSGSGSSSVSCVKGFGRTTSAGRRLAAVRTAASASYVRPKTYSSAQP